MHEQDRWAFPYLLNSDRDVAAREVHSLLSRRKLE
jgi:hypothetical protein